MPTSQMQVPKLLWLLALLASLGEAIGHRAEAGSPVLASAALSLAGTEWFLVELDGRPVDAGAKRNPPTLVFDAKDAGVSGNAGCNGFHAPYELKAERLRFVYVGTTRMACLTPGGLDDGYVMALEASYITALKATREYRLTTSRLDLIANQKVVARFEKR